MLNRLRNYFRISATVSCRDCDHIPHIEAAGNVVSGDPDYQLMFNGVKVVKGSYHGEWMTNVIGFLGGHHEPQEEKVFFEVLGEMEPGAVMIEAGSYWAYYSCWFQYSVVGARNFLIEPNPRKLELGKQNFKLNGFDGRFFRAFIGAEHVKGAEFVDWDGSRDQVDMFSIDEFSAKQDIEFIDMLHADIQGAERDMLAGCKRMIGENRIGYIFLSTHGENHTPCISFLVEHGFRIIAEHSIADSVSGDGLIVACARQYGSLQSVEITHHNPARSLAGRMGMLLKLLTDDKHRKLFRLSSKVAME